MKPQFYAERKRKRKKKKKDEEPEEVIMPYEHVKLYQQPPDKKRPIVLVGPRNVGRYELRDKLTSDEPHLFTVPIAHTSRPSREAEIQGQDYYFVDKAAFEKLKSDGKFVEDGEFQKNYYGTSIQAVREVIDNEKYAILVLNAPSINVMRKENLKPFVIFIKPPSKDQIAKNLIREDKDLNESEIELMITSGRLIESDYGHLFDEIIINLSQEQTQRELRRIINRLETMPQWVPVQWIPDGTH
jgi:MAGUK p55 subfamily protein 5